ncbi:hypothetical protein [Chlorobium sp.]|uniref:hypothetical protein n=1 Tax=Chlorobium sp. TaxID=1095 RepID=UPI0025C42189|nr:hypothetical protein [Chlorobium sp.]MCF8271904.1 hypothetical protein [Chlorobium sp.]MCF8291871.1 hypothetical protein [Chlorobium sp.]MCF8385993.1 hypothetical protein [Chlorobium sp.]
MKKIFNKMAKTPQPARFSTTSCKSESDIINVIYLAPISAQKGGGISGGMKVIYRHSTLINELFDKTTQSAILHAENMSFSCKWFQHNARIKKNMVFNPSNDFIIIPEFWAERYAPQCKAKNISYAIFVQGGYLFGMFNNDNTDKVYRQAEFIITISDDATECCKLAFPEMSNKIFRIHYHIDSEKFDTLQIEKQNIITYMPRRLQKHSNITLFFLKRHLPSHWKVTPIQDMNELEVANLLKQSKIFLSFSELEGLGLPPIEAALSGNKVIGYTGEGGKEYWNPPIFSEIMMGDIKSYVKAILSEIDRMEQGHGYIPDQTAINNLNTMYSAETEKQDLQHMVTTISDVFSSK